MSNRHEQALVCHSNIEIVDASRWCTFNCKMANNCFISVFFTYCVGLIYSAISPPSIITTFVHHPSTLAVEFCYSETGACSFTYSNDRCYKTTNNAFRLVNSVYDITTHTCKGTVFTKEAIYK